VVRGVHSSIPRISLFPLVLGIFAIFAISVTPAAGAPLPLRDPEPQALPRAPEYLRMPVELVPKAVVALPLCGSGVDADRCGALGPAFGPEFAALYRPSPYFAFGVTFGYVRGAGSLAGNTVTASRLELSVTGRVYLIEAGGLDPYLEGSVGWASERASLAAPGGVADQDSAWGPGGRAGGGLDWFAVPSVKLGVFGGYSALIFTRSERCRAGFCAAGDAPGSVPTGAVTLGIGVSVLFGEAL
jgi:hypothetical protein